MLDTNSIPDFHRRVIPPRLRDEVHYHIASMGGHRWQVLKRRMGITRKPAQFTIIDYAAVLVALEDGIG